MRVARRPAPGGRGVPRRRRHPGGSSTTAVSPPAHARGSEVKRVTALYRRRLARRTLDPPRAHPSPPPSRAASRRDAPLLLPAAAAAVEPLPVFLPVRRGDLRRVAPRAAARGSRRATANMGTRPHIALEGITRIFSRFAQTCCRLFVIRVSGVSVETRFNHPLWRNP